MERNPGNDPHEDSSGFSEEYWELVEGLWTFDPEGYPQRIPNGSGGYDLVFFDSNYMPVRSVPMAPDGSIDTSSETAQQPNEPPTPPTPEA